MTDSQRRWRDSLDLEHADRGQRNQLRTILTRLSSALYHESKGDAVQLRWCVEAAGGDIVAWRRDLGTDHQPLGSDIWQLDRPALWFAIEQVVAADRNRCNGQTAEIFLVSAENALRGVWGRNRGAAVLFAPDDGPVEQMVFVEAPDDTMDW